MYSWINHTPTLLSYPHCLIANQLRLNNKVFVLAICKFLYQLMLITIKTSWIKYFNSVWVSIYVFIYTILEIHALTLLSYLDCLIAYQWRLSKKNQNLFLKKFTDLYKKWVHKLLIKICSKLDHKVSCYIDKLVLMSVVI